VRSESVPGKKASRAMAGIAKIEINAIAEMAMNVGSYGARS
jgi:hypothetical protein